MRHITLYGLQRTGTNLLKWIMDRNFLTEVDQNNKHYAFTTKEILTNAQPIIIITKNPYSWLPSLYRWRKTCEKMAIRENEQVQGKSFSEFVLGSTDPIHRWNKTNLKYTTDDVGGLPRIIVRYEDLYKDPEKVTRDIAKKLEIPFKGGFFVLPKGKVNSVNKDTKKKFDASYYTDKRYIREYTPNLLQCVYKRLDPKVLEIFGYDKQP
jgi:hypothetical protein